MPIPARHHRPSRRSTPWPAALILTASLLAVPYSAEEAVSDAATAANEVAWPPAGQSLPAELVNERFFLQLRTADGEALRLFTDTGGGMVLRRTAAERLGLLPSSDAAAGTDGSTAGESGTEAPAEGPSSLPLPPLAESTWIPPAEAPLWLAPADGSPHFLPDGMLGAAWFKDRRWTFDYDEERLLYHPDPIEVPPALAGQTVELGFHRDEDGAATTGFPRITVMVEGEPLELLFDTGATSTLPPAFNAGDGAYGASFITRSTADAWRRAHPDWTVVGVDAEAAADPEDDLPDGYFIAVPEVEIAGLESLSLGRVWFVTRPDANFHDYMSQWMDRRVEGALGGNALGGLQVTVDYPAARATFVRPASDPGRARLVTEDLARFYAAFDAAAAVDGDLEAAADLYQRLYVEPATSGLASFVASRITSAADLARVVEAHRPYYAAVRSQLHLDEAREAAIRTAFHRLAELYPQAIFPPTYFVVGRLNSGGTTSANALLIGMEMYALADDTPAEAIPPFARHMVKPAEQLPHIVAHELIHAQQQGGRGGLLQMSLREGGADFLAGLIHDSGDWEPNYLTWGREHAERVRQRFLDDRAGGAPEISTWFYNYNQDDPQWHPDLGYYVGWEIARRYYAQADDKKTAVRDLIRLEDPEAMLTASGYTEADLAAGSPQWLEEGPPED